MPYHKNTFLYINKKPLSLLKGVLYDVLYSGGFESRRVVISHRL